MTNPGFFSQKSVLFWVQPVACLRPLVILRGMDEDVWCRFCRKSLFAVALISTKAPSPLSVSTQAILRALAKFYRTTRSLKFTRAGVCITKRECYYHLIEHRSTINSTAGINHSSMTRKNSSTIRPGPPPSVCRSTRPCSMISRQRTTWLPLRPTCWQRRRAVRHRV